MINSIKIKSTIKQKITLLFFVLTSIVVTSQTVKIGETSYGSISDAITAANENDVILITGVHTESITLSKSITLKGTDPSTDIIQAAATAVNDGTGNRVINISRAEDTDVLTITIENLGIRNGNADSNTNGGGINVDKVTGLLTLKNLIIENNYSDKNGGGLSFAGSNVDVVECTIKNNESALDGGGIIATPNNGAGINSVVNIQQSLISSNNGRNGGGIYINGNNGFGNDYIIDVNVENSTVSNNNATSASGGAGGGAIWCKVAKWTTNAGGNGTSGNINLKLVHATVYNNTHAALVKSGMRFTGPAGFTTNFSAYNSIIVSADDVASKVINFTNANLTNMVNCILGGLEGAATANSIVDDATKNNLKGKTATQAGLTSMLTDEGGNTQVIAITDGSNSDDFCTASAGISLPTIDQRGATREGNPDAGAFEFGGTLSLNNVNLFNKLSIYPNPANNTVSISGVDEIQKITIFSLLGKKEVEVSNKNFINVSQLSNGIYFIQIEKNNRTYLKKFLKN
jgi:hypothetical protein